MGRQRRWPGAELLKAYISAGKSAEGVALVKENLEAARKARPANAVVLANALATNGLSLLQLKAWAAAETVLRECMAIREKQAPDEWTTFSAKSMLGAALFGQKKYADAAPMLLAGFEGLKQRFDKSPDAYAPGSPRRKCFDEALDRLIQLAEATNTSDDAKKWNAEGDRIRKAHPAPVATKAAPAPAAKAP